MFPTVMYSKTVSFMKNYLSTCTVIKYHIYKLYLNLRQDEKL